MKHLKTFEDTKEDFKDFKVGDTATKEDYKVGDTIYCIDNLSYEEYLTLGEKYTIQRIRIFGEYTYYYIFPVKKNTNTFDIDGFNPRRFTKDPYHPEIIKAITNKYNL